MATAGVLVLDAVARSGEFVCRNCSRDLERVLDLLGIDADSEGATMLDEWTHRGHAGLEIPCGSDLIVADAFHNVYVRVEDE